MPRASAESTFLNAFSSVPDWSRTVAAEEPVVSRDGVGLHELECEADVWRCVDVGDRGRDVSALGHWDHRRKRKRPQVGDLGPDSGTAGRYTGTTKLASVPNGPGRSAC